MLFRWRGGVGPTLVALRRWRARPKVAKTADHLNNLACTRADAIGTWSLDGSTLRDSGRVAFTT